MATRTKTVSPVAGDAQEWLAAFYEEHHTRLLGYARRYGGLLPEDAEDAEDAVQDAWVRAARDPEQFRQADDPLAYFFEILRELDTRQGAEGQHRPRPRPWADSSQEAGPANGRPSGRRPR
jgi:DNA-directed RNA polymerase specialized sigma24 family protein